MQKPGATDGRLSVDQFLAELGEVRDRFEWYEDEGGVRARGVDEVGKRQCFCPITALVFARSGCWHTLESAQNIGEGALNLSQADAHALICAADEGGPPIEQRGSRYSRSLLGDLMSAVGIFPDWAERSLKDWAERIAGTTVN